ncbi:MAG TPA: hypothetical protein VHR66_03070 [Gemmataceae bacterium]|jgi:hypothetical protein|nr:hypothetical protein [Gemmataceae bacterium]
MTRSEFVQLCKAEKESLIAQYMGPGSTTAVAAKIAVLRPTPEQLPLVREIIDGVLTDVFYTLLLALDGCASLGGRQINYRLMDEEGNLLTGSGEIEPAAFDAFQ